MKSTRQPAQPGGHSVDAAAGFGRRSAGTNGGAGCPDSLAALARQAERVLRSVYRCPGMNLGMNLGECAGAGVAGHVHLHVVPRWPGDANFMTTTAETRVLPEELSTTLARVRAEWGTA